MRLLKHSSIDIDGIKFVSLVKVDQNNIWIMITDDLGKVTSWRIKTNRIGLNIQTLCTDNDFEIDFELKKVLNVADEDSGEFLLVHSEDNDADLLTVSPKEICMKQFGKNIENIIVLEKFNNIGDVIFATTILKSEGTYIMLITESFDIYIDRYDQLTENTSPLIQANLIECSELNNK